MYQKTTKLEVKNNVSCFVITSEKRPVSDGTVDRQPGLCCYIWISKQMTKKIKNKSVLPNFRRAEFRIFIYVPTGVLIPDVDQTHNSLLGFKH